MTLSRRQRWWILVACALALAAGIAALVPARDWTSELNDWLLQRETGEAIVLFTAIHVIGALALVPAWIFPIAAGAAFGFGWGLAASLAASVISALAAFLVGRHVIRERVSRFARQSDTFHAVDKAVAREPFKVVALLRLSPVLPSGLKSYFLGITRITCIPYLLASALGMLPGLLIKVYLGDAGRDALLVGGPAKWAVAGAGLAATIAITVLVGRFARRRLGL